MTRPPLALGPIASRLTAVGMLSLAGCAPIGSSEATGEPVVGKLQFNDRVIELTPAAFADGPNAVPKNAIGHIIADIDLKEARPGEDESPRRTPIDDDGEQRDRGLRR
jgi:hypothetical protein